MIKDFLTWCIRHFPFISGLPECRFDDLKSAFKELTITLSISMCPLLIWIFIGTYILDGRVVEVFYESIKNGELFLYAASVLAPIIYIAIEEPRSARAPFPTKPSHVGFTVLILVLCASVFGFQRSGKPLSGEIAVRVSIYLLVFSIILLYLALVYRYMRIPEPEMLKESERDLTEQLRLHRS